MALYFLLVYCLVYVLGQEKQSLHTENFYLQIFSHPSHNENKVTARYGGNISVTCEIKSVVGGILPSEFLMTWYIPQTSQNSMNNRIHNNHGENILSLTIYNLSEKDSGDYKCRAELKNDPHIFLQKTLHVAVKNKKICGSLMFDCSGTCIGRRFVCDGRKDCNDGSDELEEQCGPDPCHDKLRCDDGRCIPMSWCCEEFHSTVHFANCSTVMKLQCCQQLLTYRDGDPNFISDQQRSSDVGFLQTTVYTVIGCAIVFTSIVTILAISICRIHMNRAASHCTTSRGPSSDLENRTTIHHHALQHVPIYDLDVFSAPSEATSSRSGLLVAYNINSGVQFVGHPVNPPPYSEVAEPPPKEGPPPPYASREDINSTRVDIDGLSEDTFSTNIEVGEGRLYFSNPERGVRPEFRRSNMNFQKLSDDESGIAASSNQMLSAGHSDLLESDPLIPSSSVCFTHDAHNNSGSDEETCHLQESTVD